MDRYRSSTTGFGIGGGWTPAVKTIVIVCAAAFVLQMFDQRIAQAFTEKFGLRPYDVTHRFFIWQLATYIFLHGGLMHILFNMLGLYMFGSELERMWGTRQFTKYFFICGIGAALTSVIVSPSSAVYTIGASGAIYGILLAYGLLFPDRIIYLYMVIPVKAKWLVMIIGAIAFLSSMSATGSGIAHVAHLGGMIFGFLYLRGGRVFPDIRGRYERWQRARLRRKFEVYYNERRRNDDQEKFRKWRN